MTKHEKIYLGIAAVVALYFLYNNSQQS